MASNFNLNKRYSIRKKSKKDNLIDCLNGFFYIKLYKKNMKFPFKF